ncbi:peptidoglycan-binding protein [Streptomyces collinus]|uniref:peptidoglycan-binding protein n=1 Tax=Streptomyces collinus TaxID=42684 RepID=UPI003829C9B1
MEPPNGHPCPECGAPRQRDNTPACACTDRAAEALRDARTTEAAAAEDFDPLRIRPYVEITPGTPSAPEAQQDRRPPEPDTPRPDRDGRATPPQARLPHTGGPARPPEDARPPATPTSPAPGLSHTGWPTRSPGDTLPTSTPTDPAEATMPPAGADSDGAPEPGDASLAARQGDSRPVAGGALPHTEVSTPGSAAQPPSPADATMPLRPVGPDPAVALPTPLAPAPAEPSVTDLRTFDGTVRTPLGASEDGRSGARRPRRRNTLLLAAAGACVAVVAAAGYASGLFSYESPSRDTALPDDIRASVPDAPSSSAASTPPKGSASAAPPAPAAPRPTPSRTASPSASPSPSAPSASASPSQSPSPSASQPSASATGPGQTAPDNSRQNKGPAVLRLGDDGPEVTELQLRLRQLRLYDDDTDGSFDDRLEDAVRTYQWSRGIQVDDLGVYDRETRAKLESETREP